MSLSAALASTVFNPVDFTVGGSFRVLVTITTSGTYATHGVTLDLSQLGIPSEYPPTDYHIFETPSAGSDQSGSDYLFCPGTTQANGVLQIFKGGTQQTDATAFPTTTLSAVLWFPNL